MPETRPSLLWIYPVLLAAVVLAIYSPAIGYDFAPLDDDVNLLLNPHHGPLNPRRLEWALTDTSYIRRYQPFGWIVQSGVAGVSGLSPWGYHALNIGLHALNAVLLFVVLRQLLRRLQPTLTENQTSLASALAAAWWALHPLHVEPIAWCSGIPYGLAMGFLLLALHWHLAGRMRLSAVAFASGLLSYPIAMGAAAFVPLLDWACGVRGRRLVGRTLPYVLITLVIGIINIRARVHTGLEHAPVPTWDQLPLDDRALRALGFLTHYWWKAWLPFDLAPVYRELLLPLSSAQIAGSVALASALMVAAWRWRNFALLALAHGAILFPLIGITELVHFPHDRYALWSNLVLAAGLAFVLARSSSRVARGIMAAGVALFAILTMKQLPVWRSTATVAASIRSHLAPGDTPAIRDIRPSMWLFRAGDYAGAQALLDQELVGRPQDTALLSARQDLRDLLASHQQFVAGLGLRAEDVPPIALIHQRLAVQFISKGEMETAAWHLAEIARLAPLYYTQLSQAAANPAKR